MKNYKEIIKRNPAKRFGKPCIRDTRISVFDILNWLANGMTVKEILEDFKELNEDDVMASLSYAADREHKIELV